MIEVKKLTKYYGDKPGVFDVSFTIEKGDTVGLVGDSFLDPLSYVNLNLWERAGIEAYERVNTVSLKIDAYDEFKKSAVDPYVSLRNAYLQNRQYGLQK